MIYTELVSFLKANQVENAAFHAICIMEQVMQQPFVRIQDTWITQAQRQAFWNMAERRVRGEPLQYILGEWEFYGLKIFVGKGVLIPRAETEILVDTVLALYKQQKNLKILDLCTGSGCIALALQRYLTGAQVFAVDTSSTALEYAKKNIAYHHADISLFHNSVLHRKFAEHFENFDIIVSNPPYLTCEEMHTLQAEVRHEPVIALDGVRNSDKDGTYFYRKITSIWKDALKPHGLLAFEIGWQQAKRVCQLLDSNGFRNIRVIQDLEQRDRVITGEKI